MCCDAMVSADLHDLPLLAAKDYTAPSLFEPVNLLREARRQKNLPHVAVPTVGLLDPDGDIVRYLAATGRGHRHPGWACYHTEMWTVDLDGIDVGVVGMAVGAPFAVLVAEQLAVSGADTPRPASARSCASRMSPTPWPAKATTSRKASTTAYTTRSPSPAPPP